LSGKDSMFQEGQAIARNGIPAQGVPACAACHGDLGQGSEIGPRLAGQNAMYIEGQLKAFNSGSRQTAQSAFMQPVVKDLAGDDIKAVAHYYESISESPVVRRSSSPRSR